MAQGLGISTLLQQQVGRRQLDDLGQQAETSVSTGSTPQQNNIESRLSSRSQTSIPQLRNDPIGSLGFALQNAGAALNRQQLPMDELRKNMLLDEQLRLKSLTTSLNAMGQIQKLAVNLPDDKRDLFVQNMATQFENAGLAGFGALQETFTGAFGGERFEDILKQANEFAPQLRTMARNPTELIEILNDGKTIPRLEKQRDLINTPIINSKMRVIQQMMNELSPDQTAGIPRDEQGNMIMTETDLIQLNESIPSSVDEQTGQERMKFSQSELNTMQRNPDLLIPFGIKTAELQKFAAKEQIKEGIKGVTPDIRTVDIGGEKFLIGSDKKTGNELFKTKLGDAAAGGFKKHELDAGLAAIITGQDITNLPFPQAVKDIVGDMSAVQAADFKEQMASNRFDIQFDDQGNITSITSGTGGGESTEDKLEAKARNAATTVALQGVESAINISAVLGDLAELDDVTGIKGGVADAIGGIFGQIDKDLGNNITMALTGGATEKELAAFRANAQTIIARNISTISGEESGRFTKAERDITEAATKLISLKASKPQVEGALQALLKLKLISIDFASAKAGITPTILNNSEGITKELRRLRGFRLSKEQAIDVIEQMQKGREEIQRLRQ